MLTNAPDMIISLLTVYLSNINLFNEEMVYELS